MQSVFKGVHGKRDLLTRQFPWNSKFSIFFISGLSQLQAFEEGVGIFANCGG
jgi:hypothetical protein